LHANKKAPMKYIVCLVFVYLAFCDVKAQSYYELQYKNYNEITFQYKSIKKLKKIKSIISETKDNKLINSFKKYRRQRIGHAFFARLRDFGLIYGVTNESFKPRINPISLAVGGLGIGGELLFRKRAKKKLEKLVEDYNAKVINQ
jgi:hypothetical protein